MALKEAVDFPKLTEEEKASLPYPEDLPISMSRAITRLDDISLTKSGDLIQSPWFREMSIDMGQYGDIQLTPAEAGKLKNRMMKLRSGFTAATPMICPGGDICAVAKAGQCAFADIGHAPVSMACPIELSLLITTTMRYAQDLNVGPEDFIDIQMIKELGELEVLEWRTSCVLSTPENAMLVKRNVVAYNEAEGVPIEAEQINQAMELKLKIKKERTRLLDALVGTRREKYKKEAALKQREADDISTIHAELREKLKQITTVVDAKFVDKTEQKIADEIDP